MPNFAARAAREERQNMAGMGLGNGTDMINNPHVGHSSSSSRERSSSKKDNGRDGKDKSNKADKNNGGMGMGMGGSNGNVMQQQQQQQQHPTSSLLNRGLGGGSAKSPMPSRSVPNLQNIAQLPGAAHPFWWHSRLYPEAGPSMAGTYNNFDNMIELERKKNPA